jgi:uncharacterized protein (TIGR02246 family)
MTCVMLSDQGRPNSGRINKAGYCLGRSQLRRSSMKRILTWSLLGSVLLLGTAWAQAQESGGTEQAVAALEQKWMQGQKTNNPDLIAPLLADNIVTTSSEGKVLTGKDAVMQMAKGTKYTSMDYEDVKVNVFGDTAVATGGGKSTGTDSSGKHFVNHERWTDTWVKMRSGEWQCVASQTTRIKS